MDASPQSAFQKCHFFDLSSFSDCLVRYIHLLFTFQASPASCAMEAGLH